MNKAKLVARVILGLIFVVFGLNGFLGFLPMPPLPEEAGKLMGAFAAAGYMFPMIKGLEVIVGILLLANLFVPLALILLAPITVNILLFHGVLAPAGMALPLVILVLHLFLAYAHKESYETVLKMK